MLKFLLSDILTNQVRRISSESSFLPGNFFMIIMRYLHYFNYNSNHIVPSLIKRINSQHVLSNYEHFRCWGLNAPHGGWTSGPSAKSRNISPIELMRIHQDSLNKGFSDQGSPSCRTMTLSVQPELKSKHFDQSIYMLEWSSQSSDLN